MVRVNLLQYLGDDLHLQRRGRHHERSGSEVRSRDHLLRLAAGLLLRHAVEENTVGVVVLFLGFEHVDDEFGGGIRIGELEGEDPHFRRDSLIGFQRFDDSVDDLQRVTRPGDDQRTGPIIGHGDNGASAAQRLVERIALHLPLLLHHHHHLRGHLLRTGFKNLTDQLCSRRRIGVFQADDPHFRG